MFSDVYGRQYLPLIELARQIEDRGNPGLAELRNSAQANFQLIMTLYSQRVAQGEDVKKRMLACKVFLGENTIVDLSVRNLV